MEVNKKEKCEIKISLQNLQKLIKEKKIIKKELFFIQLIKENNEELTKFQQNFPTTISNLPFDHLSIKIIANKSKKTITFYSNGIGMTKLELISRFGIYKSRSLLFYLQNISKK